MSADGRRAGQAAVRTDARAAARAALAAASPLLRGTLIAGAAVLAAVLAAAALALLNPTYSHGGPVPFHFAYRDLYRTAPGPGQIVRVQRLRSDGRVRDSLASRRCSSPATPVNSRPSCRCTRGADRPVRARYARFALRGEGKSTVNSAPAYNIYFSMRQEGQAMYGRDVLLLHQSRGARDGVQVTLLTVPSSSTRSPIEVASTGPLAEALKSLTLG